MGGNGVLPPVYLTGTVLLETYVRYGRIRLTLRTSSRRKEDGDQ